MKRRRRRVPECLSNLRVGDALPTCPNPPRAVPVPKRVPGLGAWNRAFEVLGYVGAVTNSAIIGISVSRSSLVKSYDLGPLQLFLLCAAVEHALILFKLLVEAQIPDMPLRVRNSVLKEALERPAVIRASFASAAGGAAAAATAARGRGARAAEAAPMSSSGGGGAVRSKTLFAVDVGAYASVAGLAGKKE